MTRLETVLALLKSATEYVDGQTRAEVHKGDPHRRR